MNKPRIALILLMVLTMMVAPTKAFAESKQRNFQEELELEIKKDKQELIDKEERKKLIRKKYFRTEYKDLKKELEESDYEDKELQIQALDEIMDREKSSTIVYGTIFMVLIMIGIFSISKS